MLIKKNMFGDKGKYLYNRKIMAIYSSTEVEGSEVNIV